MTETNSSEQPTPAEQPPPRRGSWLMRFAIFFVLAIVAVVWFLPSMAGKLVSHSNVANWVGADIPAEIEFESASLSWQAPVMIHDVRIRGTSGKAEANIESITTQQTLWSLVTNRTQPLELYVEGFSGEIVVPNTRMAKLEKVNSEKALQQLMQHGFRHLPRAITLHVSKSKFRLVDEQKEELTSFNEIAGEYAFTPKQETQPAVHTFQFAGKVRKPETGGEFQLAGEWQDAGGQPLMPIDGVVPDNEMEKLVINLQGESIPLDGLNPLIRRELNDAAVVGTISGSSQYYVGRSANGSFSFATTGDFTQPMQSSESTDTKIVTREGTSVPVDLSDGSWKAEASYDANLDTLTLLTVQLNSNAIAIDGKGVITNVLTTADANLEGSLSCESDELLAIIPSELREELEIEGLRISKFVAQGPLRRPVSESATDDTMPEKANSQDFKITTSVAWDRLAGYGLISEDGEVSFSSSKDWLLLAPVSFPVNGGQVRQIPEISISGESRRFRIQQGLILDQIELTEPVVRQWLKYPAPLLANATAIEGKFSLETGELAEGEIGHMETADIPGYLIIHSAFIAPGPMLQQVQDLVDRISVMVGGRAIPRDKVRITMTEQRVPFRVLEGRVYHKDFVLEIGAVRILTEGSVGLDETLDLKLSIPLNDEWLDKGPVLRSLQGEVITFNVRGTLSDPKFDLRPLGEFGRRIGIKAAGGLLERILQNPPRPRRRPQNAPRQ
ncbi:MAG: hypothetical protein R3C18_08505 [Planctomycetaceae bacterium]